MMVKRDERVHFWIIAADITRRHIERRHRQPVDTAIDAVIRIADERHPLALFQPRLFHVVGVDQENLTTAF